MFTIYNYPADGESCEPDTASYADLESARAAVARRLGDLCDWRKWDGYEPDESEFFSVEAYHANKADGSGGVQISSTGD